MSSEFDYFATCDGCGMKIWGREDAVFVTEYHESGTTTSSTRHRWCTKGGAMKAKKQYRYSLDDLSEFYVKTTSSGVESVYRCPWCPQSNPDTSGHLYINKIKEVGECKKCGAVVRLTASSGSIAKQIDDWKTKQKERGDDEVVGIPFVEIKRNAEALGFKEINKFFQHNYLTQHNISPEIAEACGLFYNEKQDALLFPFINPFNPTTFSGWAIRYPKDWINTKSARKNLYMPHVSVAHSPYLVIVEGVADAISLFARGYPAAAIGGVSVTPLQTKQIMFRFPTSIDILLDKDATADALRIAALLGTYARNHGREVSVDIRECPVKDPAELTWDALAEVMENTFEQPDGNLNHLAIRTAAVETRIEVPNGAKTRTIPTSVLKPEDYQC